MARTVKSIEKSIKNLPQYKNKSNEEIKKLAKEMRERELLFDVDWCGLSTVEKKKADKTYRNYLEKYNIEKFSDVEDLKSLVQNEVLKERIQRLLGESDSIPKKGTIDSLTSLQTQIIKLKEKLGLFEDNKASGFDYIQTLKKKYKKWCEDNQLSRQVKCPGCSKMFLLRLRTDKYDEQEHPWLKDNILCNEYLLKLYKEKKITKEDVSKVLKCSVDYIDWLIDKLEKK